MTEQHVMPAAALQTSAETEPAPDEVSVPPVLVTEQEVAFGTAAALGLQPRTSRWSFRAIRVFVESGRRRWLDTALMPRLGRVLSALTQPSPHHPRREPAYFEAARMSREMERL
jgi:hypothetical protein